MGNKKSTQKELVTQKESAFSYEFKEIGERVSILSYNVLAECYAETSWFPHTNPESKQIIQTITQLDPDFFTLQECDHYEDHYKPQMEKQQIYETIFSQRPSREDGLMIGYKKSKYLLEYKEDISFDEIATQQECHSTFFRQNIAMICEFTNKKTGQAIVVVTTHLYWDPKFEHVKYHQMLSLLSIINEKYESFDVPILFTGDFNSLPNSNGLQFLLRNKAPEKSRIEKFNKEMWYTVNNEYQQHFYNQNILWRSSYQNFRSDERHPEFTNHTKKWAGTIDYIFYRESQKLQLLNILDIPTLEQVIKETSLPNMEFPSDHLPIMAKFLLTNDNILTNDNA